LRAFRDVGVTEIEVSSVGDGQIEAGAGGRRRRKRVRRPSSLAVTPAGPAAPSESPSTGLDETPFCQPDAIVAPPPPKNERQVDIVVELFRVEVKGFRVQFGSSSARPLLVAVTTGAVSIAAGAAAYFMFPDRHGEIALGAVVGVPLVSVTCSILLRRRQ
jgi:hypothetical protein